MSKTNSETGETVTIGQRARHIHTGIEGRVFKLEVEAGSGRDIAWIQRDNGARGWFPLADLRPAPAGDTLVINGQTFAVSKLESEITPYLLTKVGGRGLAYTAMRNAKRPHLLFLVNANQRGSSAVTNVWITDEGGMIRQAQ